MSIYIYNVIILKSCRKNKCLKNSKKALVTLHRCCHYLTTRSCFYSPLLFQICSHNNCDAIQMLVERREVVATNHTREVGTPGKTARRCKTVALPPPDWSLRTSSLKLNRDTRVTGWGHPLFACKLPVDTHPVELLTLRWSGQTGKSSVVSRRAVRN